MTTTIYVSNSGDDKNDGLTREKPVRSWARTKKLCTGNTEMHLLEGDATSAPSSTRPPPCMAPVLNRWK